MRNIRLVAAVTAFAVLMVLAIAGPGQGHEMSLLRFPADIMQGTPTAVRYATPSHADDHATLVDWHADWTEGWNDWDRADTAALVAALGLPQELVRIAACESVHNPAAESKTDDWGLFQIHGKWIDNWGLPKHIAASREELLNPYRNGLAAAFVYDIQGLRAWVCWDIIRGR